MTTMKKQYINPTVAIYAVANSEVVCASDLGYGGTETDGIAGGKNFGLEDFEDFEDDED